MTIRTTTVQHHIGLSGDQYTDGRIEMQWTPDGEWFNLGMTSYTKSEWEALILLIALGSKEAKVEFIHECLV
jgi:hypothetical protein